MEVRADVTVLISGGIDSISCAHFFLQRGLNVRGLFVDYGQAAALQEVRASTALTKILNIPLDTCALTRHRALGAGELFGRNAMLIFNALFVTGKSSGMVAMGLHAGVPYYDCSEAFLTSVGRLVNELTDSRLSVVAPFISWSKHEVYSYFLNAGLPLSLTYSCESGTVPTCGTCLSCRDRKALGC